MSEYPADLYLAVHDGTPGDLEFYARVVASTSSVLELGCGAGRVLEHVCHPLDPNATCVGLELREDLLARARARGLDRHATLVCGDMRSFELDRQFERIIIPYNGLLCLLSRRDLVRSLRCIARHLEPAGQLVFDAYCADAFHEESIPEDLSEDHWLEVKRVAIGDETWTVWEKSRWTPSRQRLDVTYRHASERGDLIDAKISQRYLLTEELEALLRAAGLQRCGLGFDFAGWPHGAKPPEASETFWVAARRTR